MAMPTTRPKGPLPPQQAKAFAFIKSREAFPSDAEIAAHMGWTIAGAKNCLYRLAWRGVIRYCGNSVREIVN